MNINFSVKDHIATVIFNREAAANALSIDLLKQLQATLELIKHDKAIRVVIITAVGHKAFCAGADLKERQQMSQSEAMNTIRLINSVIHDVEQLPQPVIAAINGAAFGGGLELALACDIRIISSNATIGLTEVSLGIIPGAGGTQRLPRLIGLGKAKQLIYTASRVSAHEAYEIGIVEKVVPFVDLQQEANQLAAKIARNAPLSLRQAKKAIQLGTETDLTTGLQIEVLCYAELLQSEDRLEGLRAFSEKRTPNFTGR